MTHSIDPNVLNTNIRRQNEMLEEILSLLKKIPSPNNLERARTITSSLPSPEPRASTEVPEGVKCKVVTKQVKVTGWVEVSLSDGSSRDSFIEEAYQLLNRGSFMDVVKYKTMEMGDVEESGCRALLNSMTDEERMSIFSCYCTHCGDKDPSCQCWNDD